MKIIKALGTIVLCFFFSIPTFSQHQKKMQAVEKTYRFRVVLTDKKNNIYTLRHPEKFLSAKALERRRRYKIKVDHYDLPVSPNYLQVLRQEGLKIHNMSKWNNTVVVETKDTLKLAAVRMLPFVKATRLVWVSSDSVDFAPNVERYNLVKDIVTDTLENIYGHAQQQVEMLNTQKLHQAGFRGKGMTIAIIDGGFLNADIIPGLRHADILGTRNFAEPGKTVYDWQPHGMMVLSCIAANQPHFFVGTAPEASFYLLQSEDSRTEQLVEEDNYAAALEYADSLGADVVTASLGYYSFDYPEMNPTYADLNGRVAVNSIAASLAASRGLLVLNSAGNEGNGRWKKINFPSDATDILTVGAVAADSINTVFSSLGYTADGRVKPDAMAMGRDCTLFYPSGNIDTANGTSFSCPILAGAVACLWQAHRNRTPLEIMKAVRQAGNYYTRPNEVFGYGIPDLWKASQALK